MRLIDADELLSIVRHMTVVDKSVMHRILIQMPTVDAVPLGVEMWEDRFNIHTRTWRTKDGETEEKSFIITRRERKDGEHA